MLVAHSAHSVVPVRDHVRVALAVRIPPTTLMPSLPATAWMRLKLPGLSTRLSSSGEVGTALGTALLALKRDEPSGLGVHRHLLWSGGRGPAHLLTRLRTLLCASLRFLFARFRLAGLGVMASGVRGLRRSGLLSRGLLIFALR